MRPKIDLYTLLATVFLLATLSIALFDAYRAQKKLDKGAPAVYNTR